ncbi:ABC transporter ATP-binding protein [Rhodococcus pyridinivorans]|uniref:ABC transporter ATP-binding protein n=1 Tax=Rhodococcus pyridinivorans TaxID=103816 RepID=UPI001E6463D3|nr:ABC transporter ATP-binding protein [Rhodococcus pyridinivorans]MCD5420548.1 ABC transporter ATP-binding protein [Rhodococcus pyridinivorans]
MFDPYPHGTPAVSVRNAHRSFGDLTVFTGVNVDVAPGRCCAVIGANGTGKSTLLGCVVGVDRLDEGVVEIHGVPVDESSPTLRRQVAAVLGDVATFAHLTAHEHLQLVATGHGVADPFDAATQVLEEVGLAASADRLPLTFSSGQRRRLAMASALVRPRRLLVLDEPEQHLDHAGRRWLASTLEAEKRAGGTVLMVSHDVALVDAVADQVVEADRWS